jgi:hypothetical protein
MKRTAFQILALTVLTAAMSATANARQTVVSVQTNKRVAAQQPPRDPTKAGKQAQQLPRNLTADQPKTTKQNEQQRRRTADAVVDHYVSGFQSKVDLSDEQTRRLSGRLGNYVRRQLTLADQRNQAFNRLNELNDQKASDEDIQAQNKVLETTEAQQINAKKRFFAEVDPELSVQQQAKLRLYMERTEQNVRQAIQKSRNE